MVNFHFILDDFKEKPNVSWHCGVEETNCLEEYLLHSETIEQSKGKKNEHVLTHRQWFQIFNKIPPYRHGHFLLVCIFLYCGFYFAVALCLVINILWLMAKETSEVDECNLVIVAFFMEKSLYLFVVVTPWESLEVGKRVVCMSGGCLNRLSHWYVGYHFYFTIVIKCNGI